MDNFEKYVDQMNCQTLIHAMEAYFEARTKGQRDVMDQQLAIAEECVKDLQAVERDDDGVVTPMVIPLDEWDDEDPTFGLCEELLPKRMN